MNDSILNTIKKLIGLEIDYNVYDVDIIVLINSAFGTLTQIGIGPDNGFSITDSITKWSDYTTDTVTLDLLKQYIYLKVKNVFDPSSSSAVATAYENVVKELEWRLNMQYESTKQMND